MKNTSRFLAAIALFFTTQSIQAQKDTYVSAEDRFLKDTTLVILEDFKDSEYNQKMKAELEKVWTITKYRYITESEYKEKYFNSTKHFFLGQIAVEMTFSNSYTKNTSSRVRAFTFEIDKKSMTDKPKPYYQLVGNYPSGMYSTTTYEHPIYKTVTRTQNLDKYDYMFILGYIQCEIKKPDEFKNLMIYNGHYARDKKTNAHIRTKTFVMTQEEMDAYGFTEEKVKAQYGSDFKVVTKDELNKYIESKDSKIVYFRSTELKYIENDKEVINKDKRYVMVVDAGTGFTYYELEAPILNVKNSLFKMFLKA